MSTLIGRKKLKAAEYDPSIRRGEKTIDQSLAELEKGKGEKRRKKKLLQDSGKHTRYFNFLTQDYKKNGGSI